MSTTRRDFLQLSAGAAALTVPRRLRGFARHLLTTGADPSRIVAHPVPLDRVRLTGGPLRAAQLADMTYLLSLDPDRMLAFFRIRAGLPQKAEPYGGWDGPGHNLTGHVAGHHLSAVSLMYAATGDARFRARAAALVSGLQEVQNKNGDGYLSALEGGREAFAALSKGDIRAAPFDLNGLWSPWYTLHKTFAGLRDAYRHTGNRTALEVETKFAGWAERTLAPLDDVQIQQMLNTEQGGMNEVLADLSADTGDERWMTLSRVFEHRAVTDPLKRGIDDLAGLHANCNIPKLIGSTARYVYQGRTEDILAAATFWDAVAEHHSFATGGMGDNEYFFAADQGSRHISARSCESCNVYNMSKMSRTMFSLRPDPYYADFLEREVYNHALASFNLEDGRMSYMVPVGRGVQQEYQDMQHDFTCCVGTGMENHALHGDGIYYEDGDQVWVNLYAPSTAQLGNGAQLEMTTDFPEGEQAKLVVRTPRPHEMALLVRQPWWAGDGFAVSVNGTPVPPVPAGGRGGAQGMGRGGRGGARTAPESRFVAVRRTWQSGDTVAVTLPKSLALAPTADDPTVSAITWGPLTLSGDLGPRIEDGAREPAPPPVPVLVAAGRPVTDWVTPDGAGNFRAVSVARVPEAPAPPVDVKLVPFYRSYGRRYSIYFDVITPDAFDARAAAIAAERERQRRLEAATVSFVQPGDADQERARHYQSEPATRRPMRIEDRSGRGGTGWFSYDLPVDASTAMALVVTYYNPPNRPPATGTFTIMVDGSPVGDFAANATASGFYDTTYDIPAATIGSKSTVTVRFDAGSDGRIAAIFGVRMVRAKEIQ